MLKYVAMPSDSSSSSSDCSYSYSEDSSQEIVDNLESDINTVTPDTLQPIEVAEDGVLPTLVTNIDADHLDEDIVHGLVPTLGANLDIEQLKEGNEQGLVPCLGANVDIDQADVEDEAVNVTEVSKSQVSEAAEILLSMAQSKDSGGITNIVMIVIDEV